MPGKAKSLDVLDEENNQRCTNQMPGKAQSLDDLDQAILGMMDEW